MSRGLLLVGLALHKSAKLVLGLLWARAFSIKRDLTLTDVTVLLQALNASRSGLKTCSDQHQWAVRCVSSAVRVTGSIGVKQASDGGAAEVNGSCKRPHQA